MVSLHLEEDAASQKPCHLLPLTASSSIPFFLYRICGNCSIDFFTISPFALWCHLCTIPCFSVWYLLLLDEDAASQERVSSTVGAPCNEVSLCNRAGELGLGDVEPRIG